MISWSKFKEATINTVNKRILKVMGLSLSTADECMPFGEDGCPLPNTLAIYAKTSNIGEPIVIGYINKNQVAGPGEKRLYSLKPDGSISFYVWLRSNGFLELGGTGDNLVRFTTLQNSLNSQNVKINAELTKIAAAIATLGGSYALSNVSTDISSSKIAEIKCTGVIPAP